MRLLLLIFLVWLLATWWSNAGGRMDRAAATPLQDGHAMSAR